MAHTPKKIPCWVQLAVFETVSPPVCMQALRKQVKELEAGSSEKDALIAKLLKDKVDHDIAANSAKKAVVRSTKPIAPYMRSKPQLCPSEILAKALNQRSSSHRHYALQCSLRADSKGSCFVLRS